MGGRKGMEGGVGGAGDVIEIGEKLGSRTLTGLAVFF